MRDVPVQDLVAEIGNWIASYLAFARRRVAVRLLSVNFEHEGGLWEMSKGEMEYELPDGEKLKHQFYAMTDTIRVFDAFEEAQDFTEEGEAR